MQTLRSAAFVLFLVLWTLALSVTVPWLAWRKDPVAVRRVSRLWAGGILNGLKVLGGVGHREIGTANRPATPALYVSNHQSAWETIAFAVLVPDVAVVLKEELYRIPVFGWFLKCSPMIDIDRAGGATSMKKMFRESREALAAGRSLLIFPEGTRQPVDATRAEFHRGVLLLYKALKVPVVPVAVNAGLHWPARRFAVRSGTIAVSYLPPIPPGLPDEDFMSLLQRTIYDERDRLLGLRDAA
ncbi:1-acyl-sn-glycerol-3-phosphate acyltransferase [Ancylobacter sp. 6x-1]|uniref:1-acyl-sn-glycerol-3-phosphate acyltransferase n=1 Tax=Ancylobacter crimeensis TaxID=2579147 RepID=A0ABT0D976_9HYPH|nr:lysophospholipid acyltransferase family protein [Ancylobacter crimeensis]MCK0196497.1 1-acyl-sn-glycerol-3-phosphate acyltransferase [Ancylobacter crimeensis]